MASTRQAQQHVGLTAPTMTVLAPLRQARLAARILVSIPRPMLEPAPPAIVSNEGRPPGQ